jgi:AraC-like DNA-binding protein
MPPPVNTTGALLCLVSAILCLLTGYILLFFSARKSNLFLGLSYLAIGFAFMVIALSTGHLLYRFPHFYRTTNVFMLLYMPLSYLYVRSSIRPKPLTAWQLLHLLPVVLYIVDFFPFFLLSGAHKAAIITEEMTDAIQLLQFRQGWLLPVNFHFPFRLVQMSLYWILQVRLLASRDAARIRRKDTLWIRWQYIYNALQLPVFLAPLIFTLSGSRSYYPLTIFPPAAASLLSALTLLFYPKILYNINHFPFMKSDRKTKPVIDMASMQQLTRQMEMHMEEEKPFLNPDYTLGELASAMGVPLHKLSACINRGIGRHFSDYVNQWRIRHCLELMRDKDIVNLNLNGIATKCGFNNRNTFSAAFKKYTGESPSAYLHANICMAIVSERNTKPD